MVMILVIIKNVELQNTCQMRYEVGYIWSGPIGIGRLQREREREEAKRDDIPEVIWGGIATASVAGFFVFGCKASSMANISQVIEKFQEHLCPESEGL
ncbi:unnamed protein product [Musa acuminata subsp. malaccensis]|uniref:(wild Malaysian banana) hypothetical protein n=1 Tax=Musa acuminata subsp. malaccensis TaxID=214687 RepID=A0A804IU67_MUSAM|nr:unnamed protein product [Musa acuminata subsp. malaccensis]